MNFLSWVSSFFNLERKMSLEDTQTRHLELYESHNPQHEFLPDGTGPWTVVANIIKDERGGPEPHKKYFGTKVFSPGAKVYIAHPFWGAGAHNICVIGQNRKTKRIVPCVVSVHSMDNFRAKVIYKKSILEKLLTLEQDTKTKKFRFNGKNSMAGDSCLLLSETRCNELIKVFMSHQK